MKAIKRLVYSKKEPRFKMSDTSRPQRIEVLESSLGEMEAELSHTRAQIEKMIGMMHQLLQAKSADGDQEKGKSSGPSRGDANDDSGGAGRAPHEEGAAGTRSGATIETAAGGKCPATAAERQMEQDLPTTRVGDQKFRSTCSAAKLKIHFLQEPHPMV